MAETLIGEPATTVRRELSPVLTANDGYNYGVNQQTEGGPRALSSAAGFAKTASLR